MRDRVRSYAGGMVNPTRGVLYPARLPTFHRLPPPPSAADLVVWFWIPEWAIGSGLSSRQDLVGYPALNLVVEQERVVLSGATTRSSHRDLIGRGWAVGALLRPAAVAGLIESPVDLVDTEREFTAPDLHRAVSAAMSTGEGRRERAVDEFSAWLRRRIGPTSDSAAQANAMVDVLMGDDAARTPDEAAARLALSVRSLQRLTHRHVGLAPAAMIRRRRLQDAVERLRHDPGEDLAGLAADLGYADHAHLSRDFSAVLGVTPSEYRVEASS